VLSEGNVSHSIPYLFRPARKREKKREGENLGLVNHQSTQNKHNLFNLTEKNTQKNE